MTTTVTSTFADAPTEIRTSTGVEIKLPELPRLHDRYDFENQGKNATPNSYATASLRSIESQDSRPQIRERTVEARPFTEDEDEDEVYPEGGFQAWRVVIGSFMGLFASAGLINSVGAIQAYINQNQLASMSDSQVSWIFSVLIFLGYILSGLAGPLFDAYGPIYLTAVGTCFFVTGMLAASACTEYYQFFLALGICTGIGVGLLQTPLFAIVGHWFNQKRGAATGIATVGGSLGGVVFPLLLRHLYSTVKFPWAVRIIALMCLFTLTASAILMKPRLERSKFRISITNFVDFRSLRDKRFAWLIVANFLGELAAINGITFLASYALAQGMSETLSYAFLTILSASGMVGRWTAGLAADRFGRFNTFIAVCILAFVSTFAIWLPFGHYTVGLIIFSSFHGYSNGAIFSVAPVCCSQICRIKDYGKRYGTMFVFTSFGVLLGVPLSGALIKDGKDYTNLIIFTGVLYFLTAITATLSRSVSVGYTWCKI